MTVQRRTRSRAAPSQERMPESRTSMALRRRLRGGGEGIPAHGRRAVPQETGQVVSAPNSDYPFSEVIEKGLFKVQEVRPGDHLHVSDLLHKCIRQRALEKRFDIVPATRRLTMSDQLTFAMGDAVHDTVKDRTRAASPDKVWGKWSCKCKYLYHDDPCCYSEIDQEETCPHCETRVDQYHEVSFFDEEYGIVGNPDLLIYFPRKDALHVTEIKSMAHKQWEELTRPLPEHVLQVVFYWHLMHRAGKRLTDRCSISYWTKQWQFGAKSGHKEFLVDPVAALDRLRPHIEDALAYKAAREGGEMPLRTFCSNEGAKAAKACNVAEICFGGDL